MEREIRETSQLVYTMTLDEFMRRMEITEEPFLVQMRYESRMVEIFISRYDRKR